MKLLLFSNLLLLLVLVETEYPKKCPPGQDWYEDKQKCVKFDIIATGPEGAITKQDHKKKTCMAGFVWVESKKLCAKKPRICDDIHCHSTTINPNNPPKCKKSRVFDMKQLKCIPKNSVATVGDKVVS